MTGYNTFSKGPKAGQPKTLTDRVLRFVIEGLKKEELESTTRKYRKFSGNIEGTFLYVGKNGAVRIGKTSSNSFSMTTNYLNRMVQWETANDK